MAANSMGSGDPNSPAIKILVACLMGNVSEIQSLSRRHHLDPTTLRDDCGNTALHLACRGDQYMVAKMLLLDYVASGLPHRIDTEVRNHAGDMALHIACCGNNRPLVQLLLIADANPNAITSHGYTPLMIATLQGCEPVAQILLANGAVTDIVNKNNQTALHIAASRSSIANMRHLLAAGANVNAQDDEGQTPLHKACINQDIRGMKLLFACGADSGIVDIESRAAWFFCNGPETEYAYSIRTTDPQIFAVREDMLHAVVAYKKSLTEALTAKQKALNAIDPRPMVVPTEPPAPPTSPKASFTVPFIIALLSMLAGVAAYLTTQ